MSLGHPYNVLKGLKKRRSHYGLRTKWLCVFIFFFVILLFFVYFRIHDVILVVSLHLNIKLDWIRDLESNCQDLETRKNFLQQSADVRVIDGSRYCPKVPPGLIGKLELGPEGGDVILEELIHNYTWVNKGGRYHPTQCVSRQKIAIIVPHRSRERHLRHFLKAIHPVMKRQQADYGVFVIHQQGNEIFNKAKLLNIGYMEALREDDYNCFIFHDVDLIVEDDRNLYRCADVPRHLSVGVDKWDYQLPYDALFGGVIAMTKMHFIQVNGYSNEYWGWGAEDDDMYVRILHSCLGLERDNYEVSKYRMAFHHSDKNNPVNPYRFTLLVGAAGRQKHDGLTNLKYELVKKTYTPLYTNITANVGKPPFNPNARSFGTGVDIVISLSLLLLILSLTCCTCFKSRLLQILLCPKRVR